MPVFTHDELLERRRVFKTFIDRGLVILHQRCDGTADLEFPQPRHPEIVAFHEEGERALKRYERGSE
jgi:hypothetical protein